MQIQEPPVQENRPEIMVQQVLNIVLFGESGVGKSSILNMLSGSPDLVETSSGAEGCTFRSIGYDVDILGVKFRIHDTAGLNEGDGGKVPSSTSVTQLYQLLRNLEDGLCLLIFCMRAPRIKEACHKNWRLFHEIICQKQVPIVMAITGLENEDPMDDWWYENKRAFQEYGMTPNGVACITAIRGKKGKNGSFKFDEEYGDSKQRLGRMIRTNHLEMPWRVNPVQWFKKVVTITYETQFCHKPKEHEDIQTVDGHGVEALMKRCGMSSDEAKDLGQRLADLDI